MLMESCKAAAIMLIDQKTPLTKESGAAANSSGRRNSVADAPQQRSGRGGSMPDQLQSRSPTPEDDHQKHLRSGRAPPRGMSCTPPLRSVTITKVMRERESNKTVNGKKSDQPPRATQARCRHFAPTPGERVWGTACPGTAVGLTRPRYTTLHTTLQAYHSLKSTSGPRRQARRGGGRQGRGPAASRRLTATYGRHKKQTRLSQRSTPTGRAWSSPRRWSDLLRPAPPAMAT